MKTNLANIKNGIGNSINRGLRSKSTIGASVIVGLLQLMRKRSVVGALTYATWAFLYQVLLNTASELIIESIQYKVAKEFED